MFDKKQIVTVCLECLEAYPPGFFDRMPDDGPTVCPHCGAHDGGTEDIPLDEFEGREVAEFGKVMIQKRIAELEAAYAEVSEDVKKLIEGENFGPNTEAPESAMKALEIRAELFDLKQLTKTWEKTPKEA